MRQSYKKLFVLFALLVGLTFIAFASFDNEVNAEDWERKLLAASPEEFLKGGLRLPSPEQAAVRSHSAMVPVKLQQAKDGSWNWQGELAIDNAEELSLMILSPEQNKWEVSLQASGQKSVANVADFVKQNKAVVQDASFGMGDTNYPGRVYVFNEANPGQWNVQVKAPTSVSKDSTPDGYLLVSSKSPYRIFSHLSSYDLLVGNQVGLVTYAYHTSGEESRQDKPGALAGMIEEATMRVALPDGTEMTLPMVDDGKHADAKAGDGIFGALLNPKQAGEYKAQITAKGVTPEGEAFLRTSEHVFPIIESTFSLASKAANAQAKDDTRLSINLATDGKSQVGESIKVGAEVWAISKDGKDTPIAWVGGMANLEQTKAGLVLPLSLDARWIALANANGSSLELRNVTVQDPNTHIPLARLDSVQVTVESMPSIARSVVTEISEEMLTGPRPSATNQQAVRASSGKLLLVHGYCAGSNPWPTSQFSSYSVFSDLSQNRTHDDFAQRIKNHGAQFSSFGVVAHSQGGAASLHLYTYYWSGLDYSSGNRLIQSVGTPYQGTALAGNLALLGEIFGAGCGYNWDLTYDGASLWLSGIPSWARSRVSYSTTSFTDKWWRYDYCHIATDLVLDDPDDGTTEKWAGQLSGANNRGHKTGWCHTSGMRDTAQSQDSSRNSDMNSNANR